MDPIESVNFKTDSTISMINSLQKKARIKLILSDTIFTESNCVYAKVSDFYIDSLNKRNYKLSNKKVINLNIDVTWRRSFMIVNRFDFINLKFINRYFI